MRLSNLFELKTGTLEELNSIITKPGFKGVIKNLPAEFYFQCAGVSRTNLLELEDSMAHFEHKLRNKTDPTKDMIFGSAFHDYAMLPEDFKKHFAVAPVKEKDMLDTAEHLKAHLAKFIDTSKLKEELEGLEHSLTTHEESGEIPHPAEEELLALTESIGSLEAAKSPEEIELQELKEENFPSKKDFTAKQKELKDRIKAAREEIKQRVKEIQSKQKELKDQIKESQTASKNKAAEIKIQIKTVKDQISALESKMSGSKAKLIASIREFDKEVKIWDEVYAEFEANSEGKEVITAEEFSRIKIMANNSKNHPTTQALSLHEVIYELTVFWHDEDTGLLCKARLDKTYITPNMILISDYKTTENANPKKFWKTISNFEYHIQAAYYTDGFIAATGLRPHGFLFEPVEKHAPHLASHCVADEPTVNTGRVKYKEYLKILASYEPGGENYNGWKGYPVGIHNVAIPIYKMVEA